MTKLQLTLIVLAAMSCLPGCQGNPQQLSAIQQAQPQPVTALPEAVQANPDCATPPTAYSISALVSMTTAELQVVEAQRLRFIRDCNQ